MGGAVRGFKSGAAGELGRAVRCRLPAMPFRVVKYNCAVARGQASSSHLVRTRRRPVVMDFVKMELRVILCDISNRVSEPREQTSVKKAAVTDGCCRQELGTMLDTSVEENTGRTLRVTTKEDMQPLAVEVQPEPAQLQPQPPTFVGTSGCAPSDDVPHSQAFSDVSSDVEDMELKDGSDPNPWSVYMKDIYNYLRELEEKQPIRPEYLAGQDIDGNMRASLIDWLVQVQMKFRLRQETLYTSVSIVDRFLQGNPVAKMTLQLVGVTALFIASKYEDRCHLNIGKFASETEHAYTNAEICQMEIKILQALDFNMSRPIPLHFLRWTSKIAKVSSKQHILAKYLMELSIMDYCMVHILPSKIAAAALCLSLKLLNGCEWTPALQQYMTYAESDLLPLMQHMAKNVILMNKHITKDRTIKKKYDSKKYASISSIKQLDSRVIWDLAQPVMQKP